MLVPDDKLDCFGQLENFLDRSEMVQLFIRDHCCHLELMAPHSPAGLKNTALIDIYVQNRVRLGYILRANLSLQLSSVQLCKVQKRVVGGRNCEAKSTTTNPSLQGSKFKTCRRIHASMTRFDTTKKPNHVMKNALA